MRLACARDEMEQHVWACSLCSKHIDLLAAIYLKACRPNGYVIE
jgi:hypothetical protein